MMEKAMHRTVFKEMGEHVLKKQNTVTQYIATLSVFDLCKYTAWMSGAWVTKRWWEKEGLELVG